MFINPESAGDDVIEFYRARASLLKAHRE